MTKNQTTTRFIAIQNLPGISTKWMVYDRKMQRAVSLKSSAAHAKATAADMNKASWTEEAR